MEVKELSGQYTTDLIATTAFGLQVNSFVDPNAPFRHYGRKIFEFTLRRSIEFTSIFFAPKVAKLFKLHFFTPETSHFLREAVWHTFRERERTYERQRQNSNIPDDVPFRRRERGDLIDLLMDIRKQQTLDEKEKFGNLKIAGGYKF